MHLALVRLKQFFPHLNEKPLTLELLYEIADKEQITIIEMRLRERGYNLFDLEDKRDYIFLKKGLNRLKLLETLAHEFSHVAGCSEFEANAFRLIALIPQSKMNDYSFLEENPNFYARRLWKERLRLWFLFGV